MAKDTNDVVETPVDPAKQLAEMWSFNPGESSHNRGFARPPAKAPKKPTGQCFTNLGPKLK